MKKLENRLTNWYWKVEPDVGRVADGIPNRVDRLRGLGNAVVPQVAEYIGRLITTSLDA
jgi:DNA (cytosine-5)-methyltransferase 1